MLTLNATVSWRPQAGIISIAKWEGVMHRWLEYDLVALAILVFGIAAIEFLALGF
jgi:hypothetical protein